MSLSVVETSPSLSFLFGKITMSDRVLSEVSFWPGILGSRCHRAGRRAGQPTTNVRASGHDSVLSFSLQKRDCHRLEETHCFPLLSHNYHIHNTLHTSYVDAFFPSLTSSLTLAGYPTIQFSSDTVYLENRNVQLEGSVPEDCPCFGCQCQVIGCYLCFCLTNCKSSFE